MLGTSCCIKTSILSLMTDRLLKHFIYHSQVLKRQKPFMKAFARHIWNCVVVYFRVLRILMVQARLGAFAVVSVIDVFLLKSLMVSQTFPMRANISVLFHLLVVCHAIPYHIIMLHICNSHHLTKGIPKPIEPYQPQFPQLRMGTD